MTAEALGAVLAPLNAFLNFSAACFLVAGRIFIAKRQVHCHRRAMVGAVAASGLFLVSYVIRVSLTGTHRFAGEGAARAAYLAILFSHMILAVLVVPLVIRLLYLVWKRRFHAHRRLARWTFPVWLYVSVTGLVVYVMLYHVYGYLPAAP